MILMAIYISNLIHGSQRSIEIGQNIWDRLLMKLTKFDIQNINQEIFTALPQFVCYFLIYPWPGQIWLIIIIKHIDHNEKKKIFCHNNIVACDTTVGLLIRDPPICSQFVVS